MNAFQTMNARMNTAAAQAKMNPNLLKGVAAAQIAAGTAPLIGGAVDLGVGDTQAFNSGEIPLNYLIALLGGGVSMGGMALSEVINKGLDERFKQGTPGKAAADVSAHDANIKAKMKEIHRKEGPDAAAAYYAEQKNRKQDVGREGTYTRQGAMRRRLAGQLISSLVGAGVSLPLMVDESY